MIARSQSAEEATELVSNLKEIQVEAFEENNASPRLNSDVGPAPARNGDSSNSEDEYDQAAAERPHSQDKVYSVLVEVPNDAPPPNTPERDQFISHWFESGNRDHIQNILGRPTKLRDRATGRIERGTHYGWPQRGWRSQEHYHAHCGFQFRSQASAVVAREQPYREAQILVNRLRRSGVSATLSSHLSLYRQQENLMPYPDEKEADAHSANAESNRSRRRSGPPGWDDFMTRLSRDSEVGESLGQLHQLMQGLGGIGGAGHDEGFRRFLEDQLGGGGVRRNKKPTIKKSALESLPSVRYWAPSASIASLEGEIATAKADFDDKECSICMGEYTKGDEITKLPCGHIFHRGIDESATDDSGKPITEKLENGIMTPLAECCPGILSALKHSNSCPLCRHQMETEEEEEQDDSWSCPLCSTTITGAFCRTCGVNRNVIPVSRDARPLFDKAERIFFRCIETQMLSQAGAVANDVDIDQLRISVMHDIEALLSSNELNELERCGWDIKPGIDMMLRSAIRGDSEIHFRSGNADTNSRAVFAVLVERIRKRMGSPNALLNRDGVVCSLAAHTTAHTTVASQMDLYYCGRCELSTNPVLTQH